MRKGDHRHETIKCAVCGEMFAPRRNDANTCSAACRQKLYRETRKWRMLDRTDDGRKIKIELVVPFFVPNTGGGVMNLYHIRSTVKQFRGFKNVGITWFMRRRQQSVAPYAELIVDYAKLERDEDRFYSENNVDEMFTEDEARALLAWLNEHRPAAHVLLPQAMPILARNDSGALLIGMGAIAVGGLQDFLEPNETDWNLPFKVLGYYDLRFHEQVDGTPAMYS